MSEFSESVYKVVSKIPKGQTMTYKEVAMAIGKPNASRAVGNALNKNSDLNRVPCHRVIRSDGSIGDYAFGPKKKRELLKQEGFNSPDAYLHR